MAYKDLNSNSLEHYRHRLEQLRSDTHPLWGTMTPARMLAHVRLLMEASLGDTPVEGNGQIPFKWLKPIVLSGVVPFPKGKAKAPKQFLKDDAVDFETERTDLSNSIDRFLDLSQKNPERVVMNSVFGAMTMTQWARLHGLHMNHHFSQFGI